MVSRAEHVKVAVAAAGMAVSTLLSSEDEFSLFDDDDDDDMFSDVNKTPKPKVIGFAEEVVSLYCDLDFRSHFRLRRSDVQELTLRMTVPIVKPGRPEVSREKMVLMSIWVLANEESYRGVATRFGLERGNSHRIFRDFCNQLTAMTYDYIKLPSDSDATKTLAEFEELRGPAGFPGVFGCVDGTHIPIRSPPTDSGSYYNRKGFHSILLQVVCNAHCQFLDCFVGWPGSANDARVWNNSPIGRHLTANPDFIPVNSHLLGDSAYPLNTYLMTPYRDNGHLTGKQRTFNTKLSSKRVVVEQAIGLLKMRFRRLRYLDVATPEFASQMTMAACILHNICIKSEEDYDVPNIDGVDDDDVETDSSQSVCYSIAARKRDSIADGF